MGGRGGGGWRGKKRGLGKEEEVEGRRMKRRWGRGRKVQPQTGPGSVFDTIQISHHTLIRKGEQARKPGWKWCH